jgi:uncharacterized protein YacL
METWVENINNPLVLIGFMLFVFAGVLKVLLKNNIIKVNQVNSAQLIHKVLNYAFILALVGMTYGFFSQKQVIDVVKPQTNSEKTNSSSSNSIENSKITGSTVNQAGHDVINKTEDK